MIHGASLHAAQDKITTKSGVQEGVITGTSTDGSPLIKLANGVETKVNKADILKIEMTEPGAMADGRAAFAKGDYAAATKSLLAATAKFQGLQADWAVEAAGLLADSYLALDKKSEAQGVFDMMAKNYAGTKLAAKADVGLARIAVEEKRLPDAEKALLPIVDAAGKELLPDETGMRLYGDTFYTMGLLQEAKGLKKEALESYLRVVTLYPSSPSLVAQARSRANILRESPDVYVK